MRIHASKQPISLECVVISVHFVRKEFESEKTYKNRCE